MWYVHIKGQRSKLINKAQVGTLHVQYFSTYKILNLGKKNLNGVSPVRPIVCCHQVQAPGTAPLHGGPGCDQTLMTIGEQHQTTYRVGFPSHSEFYSQTKTQPCRFYPVGVCTNTFAQSHPFCSH